MQHLLFRIILVIVHGIKSIFQKKNINMKKLSLPDKFLSKRCKQACFSPHCVIQFRKKGGAQAFQKWGYICLMGHRYLGWVGKRPNVTYMFVCVCECVSGKEGGTTKAHWIIEVVCAWVKSSKIGTGKWCCARQKSKRVRRFSNNSPISATTCHKVGVCVCGVILKGTKRTFGVELTRVTSHSSSFYNFCQSSLGTGFIHFL